MKILISRTDSIGDVILTLPLCGWIKEHIPNSKIYFLCQELTKEIVRRCRAVDEIILWKEYIPPVDAVIHVFPKVEIARTFKQKHTAIRIGTSHRFFHLFTCNRLVNFTRKKSALHESQLNFKLLKGLGHQVIPALAELPKYVAWKINSKRSDFIDAEKFNLIFHMKSRGSAKEWSIANYYELARKLGDSFHIILTGTSEERALIHEEKSAFFELPNVTDTTGKLSISELIELIEMADGMVACSTGPLHIAGVSDIRVLGLYPIEKPMHAGRWMPLGNKVEVISEKKGNKSTKLEISVDEVSKKIFSWKDNL